MREEVTRVDYDFASFIQFIGGLNMSKEGAYTGGPGVGLECEWVMLNFLKNIMKIIVRRF